ncbi:MAG: GLPGLI family protein [Flavobacteriaceae bacterium]|nr:GLPGLI family protein [Flavobacteriaceae bacterium]
MKNYISLFICFLISAANFYGQTANHKIVYTAKSIQKYENKEGVSYLQKINEAASKTTIEFELLIQHQKALFRANSTLESENRFVKGTYYTLGAYDRFYIDAANGEYVHQIQAYGSLFRIPIGKSSWKLSKESKYIGKFKCLKATSFYTIDNGYKVFKKNVEAWYCPKINAAFGPRGYHGLPGLILELKDGETLFTAKEIYLNIEKQLKIKKPTKGKKLTFQEFDNLKNTYTRN